jgi:septal ring factor EnvC (AmiA/AmiB activator)
MASALEARTSVADVPSNGKRDLNQSEEEPATGSKAKRLNPIKRQQVEQRVRELEKEISSVEAAIAHCETVLQNFVSVDENHRHGQELDQHKARHAALIEEWENLGQVLQVD